MSTTVHHYKKIRELEYLADLVDMKLTIEDYRSGYDALSLTPKDDGLPIYTRGVTLASGTVEDLTNFVIGWQKSAGYLTMLGATTLEKIERKEQDYRNKQLARLIKEGKIDD